MDCFVTVMNSFTRTMNVNFIHDGFTFDRGLNYDWCKRLSSHDPNITGDTWLMDQIKRHKENISKMNESYLDIPTKDDGTNFTIYDLNDEQQKNAFTVMSKIIQWIKAKSLDDKQKNIHLNLYI